MSLVLSLEVIDIVHTNSLVLDPIAMRSVFFFVIVSSFLGFVASASGRRMSMRKDLLESSMMKTAKTNPIRKVLELQFGVDI